MTSRLFAAAGYGARAGFGNRPALLVIDVDYDFCGDTALPKGLFELPRGEAPAAG